ncbi:hypothetical protein P2H89_03385 [Paraflavitalea sp. CAU 1676]|nr:hypothetical protein [Paraflavitalea sp. CAU 1676]
MHLAIERARSKEMHLRKRKIDRLMHGSERRFRNQVLNRTIETCFAQLSHVRLNSRNPIRMAYQKIMQCLPGHYTESKEHQ